jgi:hypothetical protein
MSAAEISTHLGALQLERLEAESTGQEDPGRIHVVLIRKSVGF